MSAKHTPGPWKVARQNPSPTTGEWMIAGAKPGYLAEVRDCGSGDVEANARLIAAAPDLLEAAESVIATWERGDLAGAVCALDEAIAKAKGETR